MREYFLKLLSGETVNNIRSFAHEAEILGRLHPEQLDIIYSEKWFNLFVPEKYGGLQLSLPGGLRIEEALAWADGSVGWTVTLCSGANNFIGFLDEKISKELFSDPRVCFAGSGHPSGIAKENEDGFEITGRWKYATGAPHATIFTAVCKDVPGAFWFYRDEVIIQEDWSVTGMIATASHSFEVNKLTVPRNRQFFIEPESATLAGAIYQYPFLQFAETTLAVNISGMAIRFLELAEEILEQKGTGKNILIASNESLTEARKIFYGAVEHSWDLLMTTGNQKQVLFDNVSNLSRELASISLQAVDEIYPYCGLVAANPTTEINRVWRNLHTASQHSLLLKKN
ncbi:MAG: acyl-CoA dehydrogenase [Bacteroidota bacterium]